MFRPFVIPGSSIRLPSKPGKHKCPRCDRDFDKFKLRNTENGVEKRCPWCNELIEKGSS